jgi:2-oxoglutarate dehydrogenase E1 component
MGISFSNLQLFDEQYRKFQENPDSIEPSWRHFFQGWELAASLRPALKASGDLQVYHLIEAYRTYGHLQAAINPIDIHPIQEIPALSLEKHGFKEGDLNKPFPTCGFLKEKESPLKKIVEALKATYCGTIGIEYMGLQMPELESWLQKRIEPGFAIPFSPEEKIAILHDLNRSELFETFLHTKYVGQKRFSLEGAETMIPMLAFALEAAAEQDVNEVLLGMSHRGRLNVLSNIMSKSYTTIFYEFEDYYVPEIVEGAGDVKYHKGFTGHFTTRKGGTVNVILSANSSALESVDAVVEGQARARQEIKGHKEVLPILIHGDAAIASQGVVYETIQLGKLNGYKTGGTLHIVINNQIGYTTLPKDGRSTRYCTDIGRTFGSPVFHVNAEKPEECVYAARLALEIRQKFHIDVFIDLNCYRKYGHNEGDEPAFTQPIEYALIRKKKSIREMYRDVLIQEKILDSGAAQKLEETFKSDLALALEKIPKPEIKAPEFKARDSSQTVVNTAVPTTTLIELAEDFCHVPQDFHLHPKLKKLLSERLEMVHADPKKSSIDWGMAEHLAYASLLAEGVHVRFSGQDSRRGTFSHRHAVWVDVEKEEQRYFPLSHLKNKKAAFDIYNSPLSEYAVLAFEFGYSLAYPKSLVVWEAQYGDFANGAQITIDQYIAASEQKWGVRSGITLMLPHGYEGQGPEHSSARMERYLQLCGDSNMFVVNATAPAQLFHLLRRQPHLQKPLILFTPKVLLRHPLCLSSLADFSTGSFQEFLHDPTPPKKTRRLLLCTGKVFYDLLAERKKDDIAIVRIEQLYPFNQDKFKKFLDTYQGFQECVWVQEEPQNMGAWSYIHPVLQGCISCPIQYAGRKPSGSPAAGSYALHKKQYTEFMKEAL